MKLNGMVCCVSLLVLASLALTAQVARQETAVPLKNWTTPLYWQPNQTEREVAAQALPQNGGPQLVFSSNQVSTNALTFIAITPCRLVDTRGGAFNGISPFSGPSIPAAGTITIPVQSATEAGTNTAPAPCGTIPAIAQAYSLNLTVVPVAGGAVDYISMWPSGYAKPFVATLDDPQGAIVSNAAIVPAGTVSGGISVYNQGPATANVIIDMNGFFAAPSDLNANTAIGVGTLASNTTGIDNTAVGNNSLTANTTGNNNTATGNSALGSNTTGCCNTAEGNFSLFSNTTGIQNTAVGGGSLVSNTAGNNNTAIGHEALELNTTGNDNTAIGQAALLSNTANNNTADGQGALQANTTGTGNTAVGQGALQANTTANGNTAIGAGALNANTGTQNTAVGNSALGSFSGFNSIAIGWQAAINVPGGNDNIHIGSPGASADSNVIKIGRVGIQTSTSIAGIWNNTPNATNLLVCVDATGDLGTTGCTSTPSSRRFKEQIADMGDSSSKLLQLRPVTFFYKPEYDDGSHTLQYGLIAEEVEKVYPDMVGYDKDGQPSSVKYQSLAPMLLNEVRKQAEQNRQQAEQIRQQAEVNQLQHEENRKLEDRLAALEALLSSQTSAAARPATGSQ